MTYVYLLRSVERGVIYIGATGDLRQRVKAHNDGRCFTTRRYLPMDLIYYEAFRDARDAWMREKVLKQYGGAYRGLMRRLTYTAGVPPREGRGKGAMRKLVSCLIIVTICGLARADMTEMTEPKKKTVNPAPHQSVIARGSSTSQTPRGGVNKTETAVAHAVTTAAIADVVNPALGQGGARGWRRLSRRERERRWLMRWMTWFSRKR